ncbi:MAG: hypothetical protein HDS03_09870 [Bacteroides sp.]|nr:hypothetical protein [Bacteroides sp.]MBD5330163.1 hypothetical protein [Bacteroides sp.]
MDALGEKPVKVVDDFNFYYAPYHDDTEPMFVVNDKLKRWYDNVTDEMGNQYRDKSYHNLLNSIYSVNFVI